MIQKVKFRPAQDEPQRWRMESSSEPNCLSASSWKVMAGGKSTKDPCPDEIQVIEIPLEKAGMHRCYRMRFSGEKIPANLQFWKRIIGKLDHNCAHGIFGSFRVISFTWQSETTQDHSE